MRSSSAPKLLLLHHKAPVLSGGEAVPWYLASNIAKSYCIAAYQAIGAASQAASYINLVNPGTYSLTGTAVPTWNTNIGWTFSGTHFLKTGIDPVAGATQTWSMLCRYSGITGNTGYMVGAFDQTTGYFIMTPYRIDTRRYANGTSFLGNAGGSQSGVQAIAGGTAYINGVSDGAITVASINPTEIYIGCRNVTGAPDLFFVGNIQALAIYNTVLTSSQVLAISNAMAALPFEVTYPAYPGPTPPESGEFTIVYFGDSHVGTAVTADEINIMTAYIKNHATRLNIQAVLFSGDMSDSIDSHPTEQATFVSALSNLSNIPHLISIGNHDYNTTGGARTSTLWNADTGQSYYTGTSWWNGGFCEVGRSENAYLLLTIGAVDYIFISMEFFPRQSVIDWASTLLTTYAARKAIIVTHAYEYIDGSAYAVGDDFGPDAYTDITDADYNWGTDIWTELLNIHDNVILIHSGHVTGPARHSTNSAGGQPVHQVLFNNQTAGNWTDTAMRFMRFNPTTETINVETFSPVTLQKLLDAANQFTLTY